MPALSSLVVPEFLIRTTFGATSNEKVWHHEDSVFGYDTLVYKDPY